jgi:branched-chain amino acid transport system ATP-binding protein
VLAAFPRLAQRLGHFGAQLSGGEQQMLSIGRALMTQPDLIILDEATEGLAPLVVNEVWRVIGEIRAAGVAALIVDRDYRRVAESSSRLVVMQKGRIALEGRSGDLLAADALVALLGV